MNKWVNATCIALCVLGIFPIAHAKTHSSNTTSSTAPKTESYDTERPVTIQHHYHNERKKQVAGTLTTGALLAASLRFGKPVWRYMNNFAHMPQSIHEIKQAVSEMKPAVFGVKEALKALATKYELRVIKQEMAANHAQTEARLARIEEKLDAILNQWN